MKPNDMHPMNTNPMRPDDWLERSIAAMQNESVAPGPDVQTTAATLAALRRAAGQETRPGNPPGSYTIIKKVSAMTFAHKKIAASLLVTFGALLAWAMLGLFSSVTYADVAGKIRQMHSMTCTLTMTVPNLKEPVVLKMFYRDQGQTRSEGLFNQIAISDLSKGEVLSLDSASKTATLIKLDHADTAPLATPDVASSFRSFVNQKGEPIGELEIGHVKAQGFKTTENGHSVSVWADPKTSEPLRIEMTSALAGGEVRTVMTDIVFDAKLDPSLFDMTPPAGYQLTTNQLPPMDKSTATNVEESVVNVLKAYAAATNGAFPKFIDDPSIIATITKVDAAGKADPEFMKVAESLGLITGTLFGYEKGKTYDYLPGVKQGDAEKIVFWRKDKTSGKYFAVFGDLKIKQVHEDEVSKAK